MRRLFLPALGIGALLALGRRYVRRSNSTAPVAEDAHAAELKQRLAHARAVAADREEFESGEVAVDEVEPSVDARRRDVHDAGRSEIDRMRGA